MQKLDYTTIRIVTKFVATIVLFLLRETLSDVQTGGVVRSRLDVYML